MSGDYQIGYRRPPKSTWFRPGRAGNPRGRPNGGRAIGALLREELDRPVTVREAGTTKRMKKREVIVATLVNKAMKGDTRTVDQLLRLLERTGGEPMPDKETGEEQLSPADREILELFRADWEG